MKPISPDVAKQFCELCNWAYECWVTHNRLFDENARTETTIGKAKYFTARLSVITQEYSLLQICKLHDPAIQKGAINITIDYVVRFGDWGLAAERKNDIVLKLTGLFKKLKSARNKVLAHNDLEAILGATSLGAFPDGLDDKYFSALQELTNAVHEKWLDGPYPFNDLAGADVDEFLYVLEGPGTQDQRHTDSQSAKMTTNKGVIQGYAAQAAVDSAHQAIVAADVIGSMRSGTCTAWCTTLKSYRRRIWDTRRFNKGAIRAWRRKTERNCGTLCA